MYTQRKPLSVKIVLDHSVSARAFEKEEIIHQHEFEKVCRLIDKQIERANRAWEKEDGCPQQHGGRQHETISIFGNRGTGKTSFLCSVLAEYKLNLDKKQGIEFFDIIDPTLIEEKGHFFLLLVSLINEKVEKALRKKECEVNCICEGVYSERKEWKRCMEKLAGGIPSLDGIGVSMETVSWQDKTYIMEKGLNDVGTAFHLEESFHALVRLALRILKKKVFMIAFDDIDVDFKKGWPVLEVIRKYLTTPYIITLLSGNMKLYAKNIRKQQWRNLGKELLENEANDAAGRLEYNTLVTEIEGQYLLKILKATNRIHLRSLHEIIQDYTPSYEITVKMDGGKEESLLACYQRILESYGIRNLYQQKGYRAYLLTLSLRTQIHFLRLHYNERPEGISCIEVFLPRMYARNIDVELANNMPRKLLIVVLRFLLREKLVSEAYQLQPTLESMDINSCLMGLSVLFSQKVVRHPFLVFEYLIKIGCLRNFSIVLGYEDEGKAGERYTINGLCRYAGLFQEKRLSDILGDIMAYAEAAGKTSILGGFKLYGMEKKARTVLIKRLDSVFKDTFLGKIIAYLPLSVLQPGNKNEEELCYSIYTLLSVIGELVHVVQVEGNVLEALIMYSQVRTYQVPSELGVIQPNDGLPHEEEDEQEQYFLRSMFELSVIFQEWAQSYNPKGTAYSPHLLGKISTRFFHAMNSIQGTLRNVGLGTLMHRCIVALMNAALIEEMIENYQTSRIEGDFITGLDLNNGIQSDDIFLKNLDFVESAEAWDYLPLSKWLFTCPFLIVYLEGGLVKKSRVFAKIIDGIPTQYREGEYAMCLNDVQWKEETQPGIFSDVPKEYVKIMQNLKNVHYTPKDAANTDVSRLKKDLEQFNLEVSEDEIESFKRYLNEHPEILW